HDPPVATGGGPAAQPRRSLIRPAVGNAVKVLLSALLIWYLVSLQAGPANGTFERIEAGKTTRTEVEADPPEPVRPAGFGERVGAKLRAVFSMRSHPRKLLPIREEPLPDAVRVTYCMAARDAKGGWVRDESGPLIAIAYDGSGLVAAKSWGRGFWASVWKQVLGFLDRWEWFLFAGSFHFLGYLITSWNWRQTIAVQGRMARFWPLMTSNIIAGLFNNILPTNIGGDVVRIRDSAIAVFGAEGRSDFVRAGTVVVIQRVIGVFTLIVIALIAVAAQAGSGLSEDLSSSIWTFAAAGSVSAVMCAAMLHPRMVSVFAAVLEAFRGLPLLGTMASKFLTVVETAARYREQRLMLARIFLTSLLLKVNIVFYYYVGTKVVGGDIPFVTVFAAVPIVVILMTIVPSINGVGVRDWGFMKLLGLSPAVAIAFSLVDVVWRLIWGIVGGVFLALRGPVRPGAWLVVPAPADGRAVHRA
ncbi:MAG: flippase-like domain-containing protein, partial [Planctomycetota bacterium]|nr:flippase-like domain-containing protein [Planctomycetota bacterium]